MTTKETKQLKNRLDFEINKLVSECWKHHKNTLIESGATTRAELLNYLDGCNLAEWEDIGWFIGNIAGLRYMRDDLLK